MPLPKITIKPWKGGAGNPGTADSGANYGGCGGSSTFCNNTYTSSVSGAGQVNPYMAGDNGATGSGSPLDVNIKAQVPGGNAPIGAQGGSGACGAGPISRLESATNGSSTCRGGVSSAFTATTFPFGTIER